MGRAPGKDRVDPRSPWELFTLTSQTFEAFGFAEPLNRALTQCGYSTPTPIQVQAMQPQLEGRDLLGMAETGSGKTATFVLPMLQKIAAKPTELNWKQVSALILAPTRELAIQIDQEVASLARNMNIRHAVVLGGVSKGPQINALKRGVHVLVATPGRLLDLVNMRACDLSGVQTLVIDEADRMFDMGFIRDIRKIVSMIPMKRRTALFSATMPPEIKKFAFEVLQDPVRVDLSTKTLVVDRIDQKVMIVRSAEKQSRLHTILADPACERVIVFTRTKRGADRVAERLAMASISASAFHGNKAQNARQRALSDFTEGHVRVLVATDIAARGIDVSNITHVVNFDMPLDPETYVHRVGRTARKGLNGIAISLCDPSEKSEILAIERLMKQKIEIIDDVGGEHLPMPANRPHHRHEDPRREGAHRKGPPRGNRDGGRPEGQRRDEGRSRGSESGPNRSDDNRKPRLEQAGGYNPAAGISLAGQDTASSTPPRGERSHSERPQRGSHESRGPRPERTGGPRPERSRDGERPRHEGARSERPNTEARGPRQERQAGPRHERNDSPRPERTERPRNEAPRREGGRSDRPHSHNKPASAAPAQTRPHRDGGKPQGASSSPAGERNWNGQKPPKFLGQRDGRKPNRNPAA